MIAVDDFSSKQEIVAEVIALVVVAVLRASGRWGERYHVFHTCRKGDNVMRTRKWKGTISDHDRDGDDGDDESQSQSQ